MAETLTSAQQDALEEIESRLDEGERYTALTGYAGTGKSFLVSHLVDGWGKEKKIMLVAPTHKAVWVLYEMCRRRGIVDGIEVRTLHSALGLRMRPNGEGGYDLEPAAEQYLPEGGLVIADEASMIGRALWEHIESEGFGTQWLFVGDPAQLPPVGEEASPALSQEGPTLTKVVRQAEESPIIQFASRVRKGERYLTNELNRYREGEGVAITNNADSFLDSAVRTFSSEAFEQDPNVCRILAFRNRRVRRYNERIRRALHGEGVDRFLEGEWIVARSSWEGPGMGVTLRNSEELRIEKVECCTVDGAGGRWKSWKIKARPERGSMRKTLLVLHEEEEERYREALERKKEAAVEDPSGWEAYYELKEYFAKVDYVYAMTVHKAQGSTFETGYVDWRDVTYRSGEQEKPLLYVAVTRPSRRLALLV